MSEPRIQAGIRNVTNFASSGGAETTPVAIDIAPPSFDPGAVMVARNLVVSLGVDNPANDTLGGRVMNVEYRDLNDTPVPFTDFSISLPSYGTTGIIESFPLHRISEPGAMGALSGMKLHVELDGKAVAENQYLQVQFETIPQGLAQEWAAA